VVFFDYGVGLGGEDGESLEHGRWRPEGVGEEFGLFGLGAVPAFPEAGEAEYFLAGEVEEEGLFLAGAIVAVVPLIKTVGGDEAAAFAPGVTEGGVLGSGLASGVEEFGADFLVVRPMRDESPAHGAQFGAVILEQDNGGGLGGGNHRARSEFVRAEVNGKDIGQFHGVDGS